jgi:cGMP-dependent protein kinase 1
VASVYKGAKFIRKLAKGDSFGEQSLYYNTMRQLTIKADDEVTCLVLGRDTLNRVLNDKIYDVTFKNFIKWAFEKNPLLCKLNKLQTEKVIEAMKISSYKANESIFRKGVAGFQKIVVIIEGSLKKLKNGTIVASKGQCWGEEYLIEANKSKVLEDEIVMQTYGVLAEITDTIFFESIGGISFEEVIKKVEKNKEKMVPHFENLLRKQTANMRLEELVQVSKLADGQFGGIHLVRDASKNLYTVKALNKSLLEEYEVQKFINEEKKILSTVTFPFVVQLARTFQTDNFLFYLEEYVCGEDFYEVIRKIGLLSTEDSQFYGASIILILEYFNDSQIVSRDIKP